MTPTEFRDYLIEKTIIIIENIENEEPDILEQLPTLLKTITDLTALFHDA